MRSGVRTSGPDASLTAARLFSVDKALQHNYSASRLEQEDNNRHDGRRTQDSKCSHESGRRDWIPWSLRPDFSLWTMLCNTIIIVHQDFSRKTTVGIRVGVRVRVRLGILSSNSSRNQRRRQSRSQIGSQSGYGGRRTQDSKCGQVSGPSYLLG